MCGLLEIGLRGVIFARFFCGRPERCTFPTAPWPAAAPTTSPAPPAAKTHHLRDTGSYLYLSENPWFPLPLQIKSKDETK